jgi:phosphatidylglycerol---prolipoprotein diacylglyceryl transferase
MITFALPFPIIDPILLEIGPFAIRWYALAYITGLLLGWYYMKRLVSTSLLWDGQPAATQLQIDDLLLWITLGVVLGGRLGYVIFYNPVFYFSNPAEIMAVWRGGMSFHGGFLGVILAIILFCRKHHISALSILDLSAAAVTIGLFFGRIANFINAELYGRITDAPWAMVFPGGGPLPRHPSQLYEATLEGLVLFCVLYFLIHRKGALKKPGFVAGIFVAGYGSARIVVEFFRMPDGHIGFFAGWITMGMILSLPMLLIGISLIINARKRHKEQ